MSGDTFEFEDKAKVDRLIGTLHDPGATVGDVLTVQADKSIAAAPGGGGAAVQAIYNTGANAAVSDGASGNMPFGTLASGTELLDHTVPSTPIVLADGTYALSGLVFSTAPLTAAGFVVVTPSLGNISNTNQGSTPDTIGVGSCTVIAKLSAGDQITVGVNNFDGVSSRTFNLTAYLAKLA